MKSSLESIPTNSTTYLLANRNAASGTNSERDPEGFLKRHAKGAAYRRQRASDPPSIGSSWWGRGCSALRSYERMFDGVGSDGVINELGNVRDLRGRKLSRASMRCQCFCMPNTPSKKF